MRRRGKLLLLILVLVALPLAACQSGGVSGAPGKDGEYAVKSDSVTYDGDKYALMWADEGGQYHRLTGSGLKMEKDERTVLVRRNGDTVLHLRDDSPIQVLGQDREGNYNSPWFPFFAGAVLGNVLSGPRYHYPPTATFGRGDQLNGSVVTTAASPPKYEGLAPNPNAVSSQNGGSGGGSAATNKATGGVVSGQAPGAGSGGAVSGQAAGTGAGSAATQKGGFRSGSSSFGKSSSGVTSGSGSSVGSGSKSNSAPKSKTGSGSKGGGSRGGGSRGGRR